MSTSEGFSVARSALLSAGSSAESASASVGSASQSRLTGATAEVIAAHRGWESARALRQCQEAWEERLHQLSAEIQRIGQGLNDTVGGYDQAEAQTLADIQKMVSGLNGTRG